MDESVLIVGPPGTGKTVIAFLRGQALKRAGKSPQVVMYNRVLQRYTSNAADTDGECVPTKTLHSWLRAWWRHNRIEAVIDVRDKMYLNVPFAEKDNAKLVGAKWDRAKRQWYISDHKYKENPSTFEHWLSCSGGYKNYEPPMLAKFRHDWNTMTAATAIRSSMKDWGHLIIDEAQDFPKEMFAFLRVAAGKMTNGGLTILADENQRLNSVDNSTIEQIKVSLAISENRFFVLRENFRSTRQIAELTNCFYVGLASGTPELPQRVGPMPEIIKASTLDDQVAYMVRVLRTSAPGEVAVFAHNNSMRKKLFSKLKHHLQGVYDVQSYSSQDDDCKSDILKFDKAGTVTVLNRQSCKGLEFDMVFIPELQTVDLDGSAEDAFKMNMYVMCSRARQNLYLLYSAEEESQLPILSMLPTAEAGILEYKNV